MGSDSGFSSDASVCAVRWFVVSLHLWVLTGSLEFIDKCPPPPNSAFPQPALFFAQGWCTGLLQGGFPSVRSVTKELSDKDELSCQKQMVPQGRNHRC